MRILLYLFVLACGVLIWRRKPLLSPANLLFAYVAGVIILGDFLLPLSVAADKVSPTSEMIASLGKSFYLSVLALVLMIAGFLAAGRFKKLRIPGDLFERMDVSNRKVLGICVGYYLVGAAILFLTFYTTGMIPYLQHIPFAAKYFQQETSSYIPLRPLYVLAIDLVAMAVLFTGFLAVKYWTQKRRLWSLGCMALFLLMTATNVLTVKRGEIIMPFFVLLSALAIGGKIRLPGYIVGLAVIGILAVAFGVSPSQLKSATIRERVDAPEASSPPLSILSRLVKTDASERFALSSEVRAQYLERGIRGDVLRKMLNSFFVEIREGGRFLKHFKGHRYFWGKTFAAGAISLIPTRYCSFKDQYVIGRVSMRLFGSDPETGGGPQVGCVAESYANFGPAGVLIVAFIFGALIQRLDAYYLGVYNGQIKEKTLVMVFIFLVLLHMRGFFANGSGILQPAMVRLILCIPIYYFAMRPRKRNKSSVSVGEGASGH